MTSVVNAPPGVTASPPLIDAQIDNTPVGRPRRYQVVTAIRDESGCRWLKATALYGYLGVVARQARAKKKNEWIVVSRLPMWALHKLMDVVTPDGQTVPTPGTAHDLLNRAHLVGTQLGFEHGKTKRYGKVSCAMRTIAQVRVAS